MIHSLLTKLLKLNIFFRKVFTFKQSLLFNISPGNPMPVTRGPEGGKGIAPAPASLPTGVRTSGR